MASENVLTPQSGANSPATILAQIADALGDIISEDVLPDSRRQELGDLVAAARAAAYPAPRPRRPQIAGAQTHAIEVQKRLVSLVDTVDGVVHIASGRDDAELALACAHLIVDLRLAEAEIDLVRAGLDGQLVGGAAEVRS
jgi:hypothetical protein